MPSVAPAVSRLPKLVIAGWLAVVNPPERVVAVSELMPLTTCPLISTPPTSMVPVDDVIINLLEPVCVIFAIVDDNVISPPDVNP